MERVSEVINNIYQKYLPIAKQFGITLDLDFPDITLTVHEKERIKESVDKHMRLAVDRSKNTKNARIIIAVRPGKITITDNGTTFSKSTSELISSEHIKVKSRVGFGTTVTIE